MRRSGMSLITATSIIALALAGCSNGPNTEPEKTDNNQTGQTQGTDSNTPAPGEKVTIDYLHRLPDGDGMTKVEEIVERWNKEHPDIQVKATKFDGKAAEMINKIKTDVKAGNAPCLANVGYAEVPELYVEGALMDVTEYANKYKDNYGPAFGHMSVDGVTVGLPQDTGPLMYMYNETEFKNLGIEVPTNLEEFTAAAKKAAEQGKFIAAFTPDEAGFWLSGQSAAAGDVWYSAQDGKWKVNTTGEGSQRVAAFWQDLIDSKAVLVTDRWTETFDKALVDGKLIGHVAAGWEVGFALDPLDGTAYEGQWRVAPLPDYGAGQKTGPDGGSGTGVLKGCEHPEQAMEFNNWLQQQVDDLSTQGVVTAASTAAKTPEKISKQFGGQDVMAELAKYNQTIAGDFIYAPGYSAVLPKMIESASAASKGSGKVMDVFETANKASVDALKSANLPVEE